MSRPSWFHTIVVGVVVLYGASHLAGDSVAEAQRTTTPQTSPAEGAAASTNEGPPVDGTASIDFNAERLAVANLMAEGENNAALAQVDRALAATGDNEAERMSWLLIRSHLLLELGRTQEATEVRKSVQAWILKEQAEAASQNSENLSASPAADDPAVSALTNAIAYILVCAPFVLLVFGIHLALSRQQSRLGRGSRARWIGVAAGCAFLGFLPLATWTIASVVAPEFARGTLGITAAATAVSHFLLILIMPRPFAMPDGRPLVDVESGPIVDRVDELARRMNVSTPAVRRIPSASSDLDAMGFMSGLSAYTLLVTDGLEQRLSSEEQDAILAHELGHIANASLWWYAAITPLAGSVTVLLAVAAAWRGVPTEPQLMTLLLFGAATGVGIKRLLGRTLEYDCDRRAAKIAGANPMASALRKIQAIGRVPESGVLSWMLHATAVHPSNDERIDALDRRASVADPVQVPWRKVEAAHRRWAVRTAALLWLCVLTVSGAMILSPDRGWRFLPGIPLFATAVFPLLLLAILSRRQTGAQRRLSAVRPRKRGVALAIWLAAVATLIWLVRTRGLDFLPGGSGDEAELFLSIALLILTALWLTRFLSARVLGTSTPTSLDRQILQLLLSRGYKEALDLAAKNAKKIARSPISRHNITMVKALSGDRAGAVEDFRDIVAEGAGPGLSILCLGSLLLDEDRIEEAIEVAHNFRSFLPDDASGPQLEGESLRALGRLDEAADCANEAERLEPGEVNTKTLKARLAIARGETETARQLLEEAELLAPGDLLLRVARFELARREGDEQLARKHLTSIQEYVAATPISLFQKRLERMMPGAVEETADAPEAVSING